jgi:aryl-alcohol dehydrogenase-like predicted oxidoreductase
MDPTRRARLGKTRLGVTRLGLGTAPLGGLFEAVADEDATATVERAYAAGIRFFDTAPLYGYGVAERRLGHVLQRRPRGDFILATKVGRLLRRGAPPDATQYYQGEPFYKNTPPLNPIFDFSRSTRASNVSVSTRSTSCTFTIQTATSTRPSAAHTEPWSGCAATAASAR